MEITQAKEQGIFKKTIYIGDYFGEEKDAVFVILREPNTTQQMAFAKENPAERMKALEGVLKECIYDHNFTANGEPAKRDEVAKILTDSSGLFQYVSKEWSESLPLVKQTVGSLDS